MSSFAFQYQSQALDCGSKFSLLENIIMCDNSVDFYGALYYAVQGGSKLSLCGKIPNVRQLRRKIASCALSYSFGKKRSATFSNLTQCPLIQRDKLTV